MQIKIRAFEEHDIDALVEILKLNHQYDYPDVEARDAASCPVQRGAVSPRDD